MNGKLLTWLETRLPLQAVIEALRHKSVPQHRYSVWYYFGGMTLFLLGVQVFTGGLLLLYYRPSASEAYESVQFIMTRVPFGWLIRSVHAWAANLMVATAVAHLFSTLLLQAYHRPREITWMSGVGLLMLLLAFGFTGYLLPWNELAFFATRVGTDIANAVPFAGSFLVRFLRGGNDVSGATLTRLFGVHVAILPAITTALVCLHLLLVQAHGMSVPPSVTRQQTPVRSMPFFPHFLLKDLFAWTIALALLAGLSAFRPWELGVKADPFASAPAGIHPEWYFLWMFEVLRLVPASVGGINGELLFLVVLGIAGVALLVLPFLAARDRRLPRIINWMAVLAAAFMAAMTMLALGTGGAPQP